MPSFMDDRFHWLDKITAQKGGASIDEIAKVFGVPKATAITWVCRWQNYYNEARDIVQHFITKVPGQPNIYKAGPDYWGERFNKGMGEDWHDSHDIDGLNILDVSQGRVKTRTDSITGKRTLLGARQTQARLAWIEASNGVTTAEFAERFSILRPSASVIMSIWKKKGIVERRNGKWFVLGSEPKDNQLVLRVVTDHYDDSGRVVQKRVWKAEERKKEIPLFEEELEKMHIERNEVRDDLY
jgi:hypothetical protein